MRERIYFVIDMKCFYASVECVERGLDPFLTNLVVADEEKGQGTICLAVSPAMKKLGIKGRARLFEIPKNIKFISAKPRMKKYIEYSSEVYGIYLKYFDKADIFPYSIDEMFIDVTSYLKLYNTTKEDFALLLQREILEKLKIPCAVGIGTNMFLAKVALDIMAKKTKDGVAFLNEEIFKKKLWNHTPITDFWQISYGTEKRLLKYGITDMQGIALFNERLLYDEFGIKAEFLIDHAKGQESCTIADIKNHQNKSKSISSGHVLPRDYSKKDAKTILCEMIYELCLSLVKNNYVTNLVGLSILYTKTVGGSFKFSKKIPLSTNSCQTLSKIIEDEFEKNVDENKLIRKISIHFSNLQSEDFEYYDFFTDTEKVEKEKKANQKAVEIKQKYGKNALFKGISLKEEGRQRERNQSIGGHSE